VDAVVERCGRQGQPERRDAGRGDLRGGRRRVLRGREHPRQVREQHVAGVGRVQPLRPAARPGGAGEAARHPNCQDNFNAR